MTARVQGSPPQQDAAELCVISSVIPVHAVGRTFPTWWERAASRLVGRKGPNALDAASGNHNHAAGGDHRTL
jgi:DNA mismatch repair protein MutH